MTQETAEQIAAVWDEIIEETNDELSTEQMIARTRQTAEMRGILKRINDCDVAEALWIMEQKKQ